MTSLSLRLAALAVAALTLGLAAPAPGAGRPADVRGKPADDWEEHPIDELIGIARQFRKKQAPDGTIGARHAKAFHALMKQGPAGKAALPVLTDYLLELWAERDGDGDKTGLKYSPLGIHPASLAEATLTYLASLGKDAEPALPALVKVLEVPRPVLTQRSVYVPGRTEYDRSFRLITYPAYTRTEVVPEDGAGLRRRAADALARIGSPKAVPALVRALEGNASNAVRAEAAGALARLGAGDQTKALAGALARGPAPEVRAAAATALGRLGAVNATPALLVALAEDADRTVRIASARALGEIGSEKLPSLDERKKLWRKLKAESLSQEDEGVRIVISQAMRAIRGAPVGG